MNRRKEALSSDTAKKVRKNVKKGLQQTEDLTLHGEKIATPKKTSTRKAPSDLTPSHTKTEGNRWTEVLRKQTEENERRIRSHNTNN